MTIGERIKQRRKELDMTQAELAAKLGYKDKSAICRVERDYEQNLTLDRVTLFAEALNTTESWLMGWEEEEQNGAILGEIALNPELMNYVAKLKLLSPEQQDAIFNQIDYFYSKLS